MKKIYEVLRKKSRLFTNTLGAQHILGTKAHIIVKFHNGASH